jgi:hypothetical protein
MSGCRHTSVVIFGKEIFYGQVRVFVRTIDMETHSNSRESVQRYLVVHM